MAHAYCLEFKIFNGGFGFPHIQTCVQSMFSGLAWFLGWQQIFLHMLTTSHPPCFLSDQELYTKELIRCLVYRPDYLQSELSYGSLWELKGLYRRNYPYFELTLFISYIKPEVVTVYRLNRNRDVRTPLFGYFLLLYSAIDI